LESNSIFCATSYALSSADDRFETMVQCYEKMGFTTPCASLWAHFGSTNSINCGGVCFPDAQGFTKLNEDAPTCEYAPCLECSQQPQAEFDALAGRTLFNSGITERIIRSCDSFSRVEHDHHCVGTTEVGTCATSPTPAPQATVSETGSGQGSAASTVPSFVRCGALGMVAVAVVVVMM
jgi:hypothetical protein